MKDDYERVLLITNYHDQPRDGVAEVRGKLHYFKCIFDETQDDWTNTYRLRPLASADYDVLLERHEIWRRWADARVHGLTQHLPPLDADRERYDQLEMQCRSIGQIENAKWFTRLGKFRKPDADATSPAFYSEWSVSWQLVG